MPLFTFVTLGCKVNQYESEALADRLRSTGWQPAEDAAADLCIVNTCTVTGRAAMQSRQAVRRAVRIHGAGRVVVTGCYAQVAPQALAAIEGVGLVVGHTDKHRLPDLVAAGAAAAGTPVPVIAGRLHRRLAFEAISATAATARTRPLLKIQDGCNAFCRYCIVPHARGRSRSMPAADVLSRVAALGRDGFPEVVLTGIHLGAWGLDFTPSTRLADLVRRIDAADGIPRVRLSSVEPMEFDAALVAAVTGSPRFCRHFHIPLQSGDDRILRRMGRPYRAADVGDLVHALASAAPEAAVGLDVIVGFPGEDDAAFANTCRCIESLPLAYLHVFPFSPRSGTPAATLPDPVAPAVIHRRAAHLRRLGQEKRLAFYRRFVGRPFTATVEGRRDGATGRLKAVTDNYLPVLLEGPDTLCERPVRFVIDGLTTDGRPRARRLD